MWDDLWSRLCRQGTVYSASYVALPALAAMAAQHAPAGYVASLYLAAAIVASHDGPEDPSVVRRRYDNDLSVLGDLAERNLADSGDDVEFAYGLQALMAFDDGGLWQRNLESLGGGELSLKCPRCGDHLLLPLDGPDINMICHRAVPAAA